MASTAILAIVVVTLLNSAPVDAVATIAQNDLQASQIQALLAAPSTFEPVEGLEYPVVALPYKPTIILPNVDCGSTCAGPHYKCVFDGFGDSCAFTTNNNYCGLLAGPPPCYCRGC